jgi:predicted ATPase
VRVPRPVAGGPEPPRGVHIVVGREAELAQLARWFARAQGGARHLVFVTGEPGIGKTTLVDAFLARLAGEESLWIGRGQCVEQFGAGEAYRPVLEALDRLGRGPGGQEVVALLAQQAPTWLVQLPGLVQAGDLEALQRRLAGATRERMLREVAEALEVLTTQQPLVLVLEDLHWSDPSTLDLLAVLGRRRDPVRLLLLGTYRPSEVRPRAHPLAAVLHELHLHGHSVELPVTVLAADAIATYLTHRLPGLPRVDALARLVHQHTEGHPLFMMTLVEAWLSQGVLRAQDGAWRLHAKVEALHDQVPDSLRQMIEGQLDRLSIEEQRVLEAASVAGVEFAAAAVAAGLAQEVERVDDTCAALEQRGQWLRAIGEQSWPDGTVAGGYRFGHALYQQVLYGRAAAARRVRLHQRIGAREEVGYGAEAGARAAELAVHFARGRDYARAVQYLQQAGKNALQRSSYQEVLSHLTKALDLLTLMPDTLARAEQELDILVALGHALRPSKGLAAPEVEATYHRARELCQHVQNPLKLLPVLEGLVPFYLVREDLQIGRELGEQMLSLAERIHHPAWLGNAHVRLGSALYFCGEFEAARTHLEQGLAFYTPQQYRSHSLLNIPNSEEMFGLFRLAAVLWSLGYPDQALQRSQAALTLAREKSRPLKLVEALIYAAQIHRLRREAHLTYEYAEAALELARERGFQQRMAEATIERGWALVEQGQGEAGIAQLRQGLAAYRATGARGGSALLAEVLRHVGQSEEGLQVIAEVPAIRDSSGEGGVTAELYRLKGVLLLTHSAAHQAEAEVCFQQALAIARRQQAKSWELRAAMSLSCLWQRRGMRAEAYDLLAPIYDWFTEGFDTADLQEARALLEARA